MRENVFPAFAIGWVILLHQVRLEQHGLPRANQFAKRIPSLATRTSCIETRKFQTAGHRLQHAAPIRLDRRDKWLVVLRSESVRQEDSKSCDSNVLHRDPQVSDSRSPLAARSSDQAGPPG